MMNPLTESEPGNEEMVKEKEMETKDSCPLPDDLYDKNRKGYMECYYKK